MPRGRGKAYKGSQMWTQVLVNHYPGLLNGKIEAGTDGQVPAQSIQWVSPLASADYLEHRGSKFISELGISLPNKPLAHFWPDPGPQWDALAKTDSGQAILVEAKSHTPEMRGSGSGVEDIRNKNLIDSSLEETKAYLGANSSANWRTSRYYQYANRLAHLYFLRALNGVDAYLVMLYFLNDTAQNGPSGIRWWQAAMAERDFTLKLPEQHRLSDYVIPVFLDVGEIRNKAG